MKFVTDKYCGSYWNKGKKWLWEINLAEYHKENKLLESGTSKSMELAELAIACSLNTLRIEDLGG